MAKSSLFSKKGKTMGKGWWDRGKGVSLDKRKEGIDRIFGEKDPEEYQKNAGKKTFKYPPMKPIEDDVI